MPPGPKTQFNQAVALHNGILEAGQPYSPDVFIPSILAVENAGQAAIGAKGAGRVSMQIVGETVLTAIGDLDEIQFEPPLSEGQRRLLAGKVTMWAQVSLAGVGESDQPTTVASGEASKPKPRK